MDGGEGEAPVPLFALHELPTRTDDDGHAVAAIPNPIARHSLYHPTATFFIAPTDVVLRDVLFDASSGRGQRRQRQQLAAYHRAGPRREVAFDPVRVRAAIVTCGGLCPGMNTVVRELVVGLSELYGVRGGGVFGVRNGYGGFYSEEEPVPLEPETVEQWHKAGGTVLGTSRGGFDLGRIVGAIERRGFNQVYAIGGDGTMRGAVKIFEEVRRRRLPVAITGIPKTVDNDVGIIDRSFGFHTAVEEAQQAIAAGHVEAESAVNGVGLVKLMGRSTGHIALHATLSSRDVDCCLIPEENFYLHGAGGLFEFLYHRIKKNGHAVVVVAEGAGQGLIPTNTDAPRRDDESGNPAFLDVGAWLKAELKAWWEEEHADNLYCTLLAHSAIHGVMAGYTGFVSGPINGNYAYIPMAEVAEGKNPVDTKDHKWAWVRSITNQPDFIRAGAGAGATS
ncbi:hypothetical protein GUJ93_ZPchr0009g259 [Zizania palustris]|uniref:Phosphofructokinase domain-containing protein n=1 Tax=Zizania palustris TaxID=103762 RepID=A0A8J5V741_ZIZPA|nr:hypothetical protein GUJ93_ZPchr0009g259 [Zizania palustris]